MTWIKRIALGLLVLLLLAVGGVAASTLLSLDWGRAHTAQTAALPLFTPDAEGLVRIEANGMTFRARTAGLANDGPALVLLHGFPETSAMWIPLIEAAAAAGYRVVAIDQRGYSPGARPDDVAAYAVAELTADVIAVADAVGFDRFHLVGHDWGCVVGWSVAIQHPDRVERFVGMSIPHPGTLLADLREELPAYIQLFTAPMVPETMLGMRGFSNLREGYDHATPEQREEYLAVFSEPGALTGALNWYRAITGSLEGAEASSGPVKVPTLFVYGEREMWVNEDALVRQRELVLAPYEELEVDAGHFVLEENPDVVIPAVLEHLGAPKR